MIANYNGEIMKVAMSLTKPHRHNAECSWAIYRWRLCGGNYKIGEVSTQSIGILFREMEKHFCATFY